MAWQCADCGTVYEQDEANYCNHCGSEALFQIIDAAPPPLERAPRLRDDAFSLAAAGILWLTGIGYINFIKQPRSWATLLSAWALLAVVSFFVGIAMKNVRTFMYFAGFGAIAVLVYGVIKLL